jgi:predicted acylesterase/phospholipase RssA
MKTENELIAKASAGTLIGSVFACYLDDWDTSPHSFHKEVSPEMFASALTKLYNNEKLLALARLLQGFRKQIRNKTPSEKQKLIAHQFIRTNADKMISGEESDLLPFAHLLFVLFEERMKTNILISELYTHLAIAKASGKWSPFSW